MANVQAVMVLNRDGGRVCSLRLATSNGADLTRLSEAEAAEWGEELVQVFERRQYQFEVDLPGHKVQRLPGIVSQFLFSPDGLDRGVIDTGNRTGLLRIPVLCDGVHVGEARLE